jgi:hypothetical protein
MLKLKVPDEFLNKIPKSSSNNLWYESDTWDASCYLPLDFENHRWIGGPGFVVVVMHIHMVWRCN